MSRFVHQAALRWSDMDAYGHVNNARFLTLYEEARVALFFIGAREMGLTSFEDGIVIARHEVDYLRPVDYGDAVSIEMWVDEVRPSRFTIAYELLDDGRGRLAGPVGLCPVQPGRGAAAAGQRGGAGVPRPLAGRSERPGQP